MLWTSLWAPILGVNGVYCGYNPLILTFTNFLGHPSKCSYKWETGVSYIYNPFFSGVMGPYLYNWLFKHISRVIVDIVWYGEPHLPFIDVLDIASAPASSGKPCYSCAYLGSFAMFVKGSSSTSGDSLTPFPRAERRLGPPSCWDES